MKSMKKVPILVLMIAVALSMSGCIFLFVGDGTVATPVSLAQNTTVSTFVGVSDGQYSYYSLYVPSGYGFSYITVYPSSVSPSADLDFYLYYYSDFTSLIDSDVASGTASAIDLSLGGYGAGYYYLKVKNYTNTDYVTYSLRWN